MTEEQIADEAHRVISGNAGLPAVGFPHDANAMDVVVTWTRKFLERANNPTERQRLLFIRKVAVHVVRTGKEKYRSVGYAYGTAYLARKPETLETKLTFGGALKREFDGTSARFRRSDGPPRDTSRADLKKPLVEKPLLLTFGEYKLHRLVHARHVLDAGIAAENCLIQTIGGDVRLNPGYWLRIKSGERFLYALTHGQDQICLISIVAGIVTEMEFLNNPRDVDLALPVVIKTLEGRHGTLWPASHGMRWPIPAHPPMPAPADPNQLVFSFGGTP